MAMCRSVWPSPTAGRGVGAVTVVSIWKYGLKRGWEHTDWQNNIGQIAKSIRLPQLIDNRLRQVLPWDKLSYRIESLRRSSE